VSGIQAVIFDFGRVICDFDVDLFLRRAARQSTQSPADLLPLLTSLTPLAIRYETGLMTTDEFFHGISALAELTMSKEEFIVAYCDIFTPIPTTLDLVRRLHGRYRLALLSNTSELHFEHGIRNVAVFPLFDVVTLSYVVRSMKPDRRIYMDALVKLGLPPDRCVYIDDVPENIEAGRELGLHGIRYTTHEALLADLRRFGIDA